MRTYLVSVWLLLISSAVFATEYHVSPKGDNENDGSVEKPFRTIMAAALIAQPGDIITVHEGIYRERIVPPRGGISDAQRIVYRAAEGEKVVIKGSEVISSWVKFTSDIWKVTLPNTFFGDYNPYQDIMVGDWFDARGMRHHTGEVYLNDKALYEVNRLQQLIDPQPYKATLDPEGSVFTWYCESDENNTYIYANFQGKNPNKELVEINARKSCFYPDSTGINYITIDGFHMSHAATQWAAPTAEQIGLIGTHWSKGWLIENNTISHSKSVGITLGKERKSGHNVSINDPCKDGATHYNEVIFKAYNHYGWSKQNIGSHMVRNNDISKCEQAGIVGSLGAVFSEITSNHIHDIWTRRIFYGAEIGGIKLHAAVDVLIENNHIHNTGRGIWIDWMAQGTRITRNLFYDNTTDDLFTEVNHGPYLIDNNLLLSKISMRDWSEGGAFVHNLFAGKIVARPELHRATPYLLPHATDVAGLIITRGGDNRFINNIFLKDTTGYSSFVDNNWDLNNKGYGLETYEKVYHPIFAEGNAYYGGAKPVEIEYNAMVMEAKPKLTLTKENGAIFLQVDLSDSSNAFNTRMVTSELLGRTKITRLPFEYPDGSAVLVDKDFFGQGRNKTHPAPGPFEHYEVYEGKLKLK